MGRHTAASACSLDCPDLCGLEVTVEDGRVVEVDGSRRTPMTEGFVCGKVRNIADHLYGPDRVLSPLVRVGQKGEGRFRAASWDEALDLLVARLGEVVARSGGEAVLPYHYGGSNGWLTDGGLADRFFRRLGSSNLARTMCGAATAAASLAMHGRMPGVALEDYEHAKLVVLWGVNPSATGIHLVPILERARAAEARLVVVDPRRTPLARRADLHLQLRPGTDLPVALAVIHALFSRGLADRDFLGRHCAEVEELAARAARWTIPAAAAEAGLAEADIERFVELWATSAPAAVRCGWGVERSRNGGSATCAILALAAVGGKYGVRGGGMTLSNSHVDWLIGPETAIAEPVPPTRTINMSQLARVLHEVDDPPVQLLFVYNCNPVATAPNQNGVRAGMARDDLFVVVHEQVMTDTARWADLVLPATTFLEHRDLRRGYGAMRLHDARPVVAPPGQARSNNQLFGELIRRMGLGRPGEPTTDDELVDAIFAARPEGAGLRAAIEEGSGAARPGGDRPVLFVDAFPTTPDGKVHLVPAALDAAAGRLYDYRPDPASPEFPLALISPALSTQISSTFGQLRRREVAVELSAVDASARGIRAGDEVRVWNRLGEVRCAARISPDLRPGVALLPKGLWSHHTRNGNTANALVPEDLADLAGQATYNDARVEIARVEPA
jgi:anaerobic selenocysteine-containing dehydrogenase